MNEPTPERSRRPTWRQAAVAAVALFLAAGWAQAEFRARRLTSEIDDLVSCEVTFRAEDRNTGEPLPPEVRLHRPDRFDWYRFPTGVLYSPSGEGPAMRVTWIGPGSAPAVASVGAVGYSRETVRLDSSSPDVITVKVYPLVGVSP